jgi:ATP-dependent Clp protease ATP-binding subunit ClpA
MMVRTEAMTLVQRLARRVVGQDDAWRAIVPYIEQHQAELAPAGRPAGIFLLLGPTGTGKTSSVEALAEELHGARGQLVRINCAEFQSDHEIAKLIGAPPGYVGHRDTDPFITQQTLSDATSAHCDLSLVLFDELEKAASSLAPLLLGICDQAILRLGDGTTVDFSKSLIFLTSNLGAREMLNALAPRLGFEAGPSAQAPPDLQRIGLAAVRARFSPEFVNRLDAVITYKPLDGPALDLILSHQLEGLRQHVSDRLGARVRHRSDGRRASLSARRWNEQRVRCP